MIMYGQEMSQGIFFTHEGIVLLLSTRRRALSRRTTSARDVGRGLKSTPDASLDDVALSTSAACGVLAGEVRFSVASPEGFASPGESALSFIIDFYQAIACTGLTDFVQHPYVWLPIEADVIVHAKR